MEAQPVTGRGSSVELLNCFQIVFMPAQALLLTSWVRYSFYVGSLTQHHISVQHVQQSPEQVACHISSSVRALSDVQYSLSAPHPCMHPAFVPAQDGLLALLVSRQHLPLRNQCLSSCKLCLSPSIQAGSASEVSTP